MNRLERRLSDVRKARDRALALFLTAGFPESDATVDLVLGLEDAGADIVELGMPFSDPLADGPVIQECSALALKNGTTLETIFGYVRAIRKSSDIPLVLMGYVNPVLRFGVDRFFDRAREAGVDGVIFPEIPVEEVSLFGPTIESHGLSNIMLVTPTTSPDRITTIDQRSSGFLYCVSVTGVTGATKAPPPLDYIRTVRRHATKNPVLVGFGISTPDDVHRLASEADGVIVGSALLKKLLAGIPRKELMEWVGKMTKALRMKDTQG
jgi:tryptophan synthase alpha chain